MMFIFYCQSKYDFEMKNKFSFLKHSLSCIWKLSNFFFKIMYVNASKICHYATVQQQVLE